MIQNPSYPPTIAQPSSPGYVIGTARLPNPSRPTFVLATLSGSSSAALQLISILMDANAVPVTLIGTFVVQETGAVTILNSAPVAFLVPAGFSYKLAITSGAPLVSSLVEYTL